MMTTETEHRRMLLRAHEVYVQGLCAILEYELLVPVMDKVVELIKKSNAK